MTVLTRKENAEAVLSQLRGVGAQSVADVQQDLGMKKREVEDAIWLLASQNKIEYAGLGTPLTYKATATKREP